MVSNYSCSLSQNNLFRNYCHQPSTIKRAVTLRQQWKTHKQHLCNYAFNCCRSGLFSKGGPSISAQKYTMLSLTRALFLPATGHDPNPQKQCKSPPCNIVHLVNIRPCSFYVFIYLHIALTVLKI